MQTTTFYLSSLESKKFSDVYECVFERRLRFDTGKECALVKISPAIIGQDYNLGHDIDTLVLVNRHEGDSLFPIKAFPCFVFIALPRIDGIEFKDEITKTDLEVIAWGELYRTRKNAEKHSFD